MLLSLRLEAHSGFRWTNSYSRALHARCSDAVARAGLTDAHDNGAPSPWTASEIYPYRRDVEPGETNWIVFASPKQSVLKAIADEFERKPRFNAGPMQYNVRAARPLPVDVGAVGETGAFVTTSGLVLKVGERHGTATYWSRGDKDARDRAWKTFKTHLRRSVAGACRHHDFVEATDAAPVFDEFEFLKDFCIDVQFATDWRQPVPMSLWRLHYEIRDELHRQQLELLTATGLGARTGYGFGCVLPAPHDKATKYDTLDQYAIGVSNDDKSTTPADA